ncbi:Uncharacterized protein dnm_041100 [Desulfonema magnum]|uniref:Uncharacterized protein n=1 Tax=Desulfonema magnum TaxID=45655 RepID=A0A975BM95_9BACT|nr:Uncharacterized protein dnm_041100 [Desulfonema magnum]
MNQNKIPLPACKNRHLLNHLPRIVFIRKLRINNISRSKSFRTVYRTKKTGR